MSCRRSGLPGQGGAAAPHYSSSNPRRGLMTSKGILTVALSAIGAAVVFAQAEPPRLPPAAPNAPAPSLQSAADPGYAALIAACKTPPPGRGGRAGGPARGGGPGRGPQAPQGVREYTVA